MMLRWLLVGGLATLWLAVVGGLWLGGSARAVAWSVGWQVLPYFGVLVVLGASIGALIRQAWRPVTTAQVVVGVLMAVPLVGIFGLGEVAYPVDGAAAVAREDGGVAVGLPLSGEVVVLQGGDRVAVNRHAAVRGRRFGVTVAVPPAGLQAADPEKYGCWGVPVLSPAAGTVAAVVDELPDTPPRTPKRPALPPGPELGNQVVIDVGEGIFVVVGHLQQGSVVVAPGDTVAQGDRIGACGSSGRAGEPQVHLHAVRRLGGVPPLPGDLDEGWPLRFTGLQRLDGSPAPAQLTGGGYRDLAMGRITWTGDRLLAP